MTEKTLHTNGIVLAYQDVGEGETLLLLHGITSNLRSFVGLVRVGLQQYYRLIIPDLRGRGMSDKPLHGYTLQDHAEDITGLLDALELDQVVLVGHSFGGLLSWYLARYYPTRVKKVIILDSAQEVAHESVLDKIRPSLDRLGKVLPSLEAFIDGMKATPYYNEFGWHEDIQAMYRYDMEDLPAGGARSRVYKEGISQTIDGILSLNWDDIIRNVAHPTRLIHAPMLMGKEGFAPVVSEAGAKATVALMPHADYVAVNGNHMTMLFGENATTLASLIHESVEHLG